MLILFDIDATLITTSRSGVLALEDAGREHFGSSFTIEGTEFAGRLDPLIIADLLRNNALPDSIDNRARLRDGYRKFIGHRLQAPGVARALPGVMDLLARLEGRSDVIIGLLTGNFEDTGHIKLRACGIDPSRFAMAVWGDHSPHEPPSRDHLPPLAIRWYRDRTGKELPPRHGTIIGDTPHDVRCALAAGMRCLGVATGSFTSSALRESGAHLVVENLSDTSTLVDWLLDPARA